MSENTYPTPLPDEHGTALASTTVPTADQELEHTSALAPLGAAAAQPALSPAVLPAPPSELLDAIAQGLAPGADESTRDAARELWARLAHVLQAAPPAAPAMPALPPPPVVPPMPVVPPTPTGPVMPSNALAPQSANLPITTAVRALRQMPADQVLELLLARLRAALPPGGTMPTPKGIQFQLVSAPPPTAAR
jgi:hypothetical protein